MYVYNNVYGRGTVIDPVGPSLKGSRVVSYGDPNVNRGTPPGQAQPAWAAVT